jgi:hypothetical protein
MFIIEYYSCPLATIQPVWNLIRCSYTPLFGKTFIAPSRAVGVLCDTRQKTGRELGTYEKVGMEAAPENGAVLADVLAMWTKGYLQLCPDKNRRLELTEKGREVLKKLGTR